jgi:class 3 adenylate cyclase/TolB-like protein
MDRAPQTRRLAAIVIADVVGYTRLMERDEAATHAQLREIRDKVIDPKIAEFGGRIVKTAGDGMVLEFPSASAALRCAVDVQREMGHRNLYVAADSKIEFRIGINLGDILIDGDDIAGDGVNIAARLETLAEPGGICIGSTVYEQVHDDLGFGFIDMGEQQVKNIVRPIRAFRVTLGKGAAPVRALRGVFRGRRGLWLAGALGLAAIAMIATLFVPGWRGQLAKAPVVASGPAPAMSIAVLPFSVTRGNAADDQLSDALTQDVTTALGRTARYAHVVSHGLASVYKGKTIDARVVGRELNVRYLAQGDIRRSGDKLALTATLIDTENATQVWDDRMDLPVMQSDTGNNAIAAQLARRIRAALLDAGMRRAAQQSGAAATAVELWLRGAAADDGSLQGARAARKLFDDALQIDPNFVGALFGQVWVSINLLSTDPNADRNRLLQEMDDYSLRAVAADRNDLRAWISRADALSRQWRWAEASEALAEVIRIDPTFTYAYHRQAMISIFTGRPEDVFAQLDRATALDPRESDDADLLFMRCRAHLSMGRYDEAIGSCERSAALQNDWVTYMFLTAAYAQKNEMAKASGAKSRLLKIRPGFTILRMKTAGVSDNPVFLEQTEMHIVAGLRKAGIPEQ